MADILSVTSLDDPRVAPFAHLTERQLRSKVEPSMGIFIAESPKVIHRALDAGYEPLSLLMERRHIDGQGAEVIARCQALAGENFPVYTGEEALLAQLAGYPLTRGVLCAMRRPPLPVVEELCRDAKRVAVLEDIVDHTNIGAIFRSAAALGMDAVLLTPSCCDPLYRRSARVSMGTVFQVPWTRLGNDPAQWPGEGLERLHSLGFLTVAMALRHDTIDITDPLLTGAPKLAVVLGTEGDGLKESTIAQCRHTVKIPMARGVDSLNVAAASAVAFWELRAR